MTHQTRSSHPLFSPAQTRRGFTLLEIMLVIVIIGIVAATAISIIDPGGATRDARRTQAQVQIGQLATAVQRFYMDTGRMPANLEALRTNPGVNNWRGPYATRINQDPWGEDYIFTSSGSTFEIRSNAGGTEGGPISSLDL
jgi:general secretion pathway protein G